MADNSVWVHNLDPFLIQFTESFGLRWYSLAYLTGFALGLVFACWMSRRGRTPMSEDQFSDLLTYCILGVLLGGRLGYVLFYSPDLLTDFSANFPYWRALAVWEGGMASHGGFMGVIAACFLFSWRNKVNVLHIGDMTIVGGTLGIFFGRIANFINGELMGRVVSGPVPWAVKFPQDIYRWINYDKEKLYQLNDVVEAIGINASQWGNWIATNSKGALFSTTDKIIAATQQGNEAVLAGLAQVLEPRHPSQLYAAFAEALIPLMILLFLWRHPRRPGFIAGVYYLLYAAGRIFDEQFRLPDAHLSDLSQLPLGLTRGQFLSLFVILAGFLFIYLSRRFEPMGGLPPLKKKS